MPTKKQQNKDKITTAETSSPHGYIEHAFEAYASANPFQQTYFELNYPNAMSTLANYTIPTDQRDMIKKAKELREYDIVDYFLRLKCDYGLPVQKIKCKKPSQQKFYNKYVLPLVQEFAKQFEYEHWSIGETFPHYGFNVDKTPLFLVSEDPESVIPSSAFGIESYKIRLSSALKQQLRQLKEQNRINQLPTYLQNAISDKGQIKDEVILDNKNMTRICNQKSDYNNRPKPVLLKIAKSLILREFLIDMDYISALSGQKSNFTHVKCGDKDTISQWDDTKIKGVHDLITKRPPGDAIISTRFDIDIKPISMSSDLFDPKKFEETNKRILNYFGIAAVYMPSESGGINNSTVVVSTKPFERSIESDRKAFNKFLRVYFAEVNRQYGFSENDIPTVEYETTNLRDSGEFIKELEFFCGKGLYGYEDLCVIMGKDVDEQLVKREWDWKHRDTIAPHYEESQGLQPQLTEAVTQKIKITEKTKQQQDTSSPNNNQMNNKQKNK